MSGFVVVGDQAEYDVAVAAPDVNRIRISAPLDGKITVGPSDGKRVSVDSGMVTVVAGGVVESLGGRAATVQRVTDRGRVRRVEFGSFVGEVADGGVVEMVGSGGVVEVCGGWGRVDRVAAGGRVNTVYGTQAVVGVVTQGGHVGDVSYGGVVARLCDGGVVDGVRADGVVHAFGYSYVARVYTGGQVHATSHVAVGVWSPMCRVTGGQVTTRPLAHESRAPRVWCENHGVTVTEDGLAVLYKGVDQHLTAGWGYRPTRYPIGHDVFADDWHDTNQCGHGLHLCPSPYETVLFNRTASRWLRCTVAVDRLRPIVDDDVPKAKAPVVHVVCEVDRYGRDLPTEAVPDA